MKVSLVIPSYNEGVGTARTVRNAGLVAGDLRQSIGADLEVVVADDCSTDSSAELADRALGALADEHSVDGKLVRTPRRSGAAGAQNYGARQSSGDVLVSSPSMVSAREMSAGDTRKSP